MNNSLTFGFDLFDGFPEMCFLVDRTGKIEMMNLAAENKLNLNGSKPELFFDYVELCDRNDSETLFRNSYKLNRTGSIQTRLFINRALIDVHLTFIPYNKIDDAAEKRIFVSVRDISEEKRKELELIRFFNVAENSVNPIQITDLNGKMIYVNKAFIKASGYSKEELMGKNPRIFGSGKNTSKFWDRMWNTISAGKVCVGEVENKRKDNSAYYTQLLISPILGKDGKVTGYFGIH